MESSRLLGLWTALAPFRFWAALTPFLLIMVLAIRDFGAAFWEQRKLGEAAFEAAEWGRIYGYDAGKITTVAQSATDLAGVAVAPDRPCGCATSTGVAAQAACNSACSGGGWSQPYIVVTTSMCYSPTFTWPGVPYCRSGDSQCSAAGCTASQVLLSSQSIALQ
jgi:hypothetical protein